MASRLSLHSQLSSIMETMARSALSQVCKLVDEDSTELRLELSRLMFANSALAEKVSSLECELTIVRSDDPKLCKSYRTVGVQTVCITDGDAHVSEPPTIEGVFGKEWCGELWINRTPFSAERVTDSPATSVKCIFSTYNQRLLIEQCQLIPPQELCMIEMKTSMATLGDEITLPEIKEEVYAEDSGSSYTQETSRNEEPVRCIAEEPEQLSVGYSVDGSTCSISFDQEVEKDVADGGIEEPSIHLISLNDTEGPFSTHIIPIEEDDEVEFIQGQEETVDDPNWIDQNKQQTLVENFSAVNKDPLDNSNMVDAGADREENKVKFSCQICNRIFFHKGTLTHHLKSHKSTYCNICKQHFPRKNKLSTHTCIPPPSSLRVSKSCHVCGKTFANPSALRIHFVVHTGEKPYKCSFCGKGFTQKGNLKCHLRIHTGERPFGCGECGMTFTQKVNLNHHLMAHRNREEKRYQ